jgi:hypothetical protein
MHLVAQLVCLQPVGAFLYLSIILDESRFSYVHAKNAFIASVCLPVKVS